MVANILDGKLLAQKYLNETKKFISDNKLEQQITLAVILVGNDPASKVYVNNKQIACEYAGISVANYYLAEDTTEDKLINLIHQLNEDDQTHGILLQLPLPANLKKNSNINNLIQEQISPNKDVDGFSPYNIGRLALKYPNVRPCTPKGVINLLNFYQIAIKAKNVTIIGASNIVGRPLALEMLLAGSTVTVCHKFTKDLKQQCRNADIICSAAGHPNLITSDFIKPGAIVIDIGINRLSNGDLCGDVDFNAAKEIASFITPVPGGIGPMTVAMLIENTVQCYKIQNSL